MITYYVVQAWDLGKRGMLIAQDPREVPSEGHCVRLASRLAADGCAGVVAFSRSGDPTTGDWDDAVILCRHGELPDDEDVFAAAG